MRLNRKSKWKVITIGISREHPLFNFECLDILFPWIGHPIKKLWPFEFLESFLCPISSVSICYAPELDVRVNFWRASVIKFRACRYIMSPNRTSGWKVMTIQISLELPLFNYKRLDILCAWIEHPSQKLWQFELLESFCFSFSSVLKYYAPELDIRVISYDDLNFSRASVVQFLASGYTMLLNRTSKWKVMTIGISQEHSFFNFERLYILCTRIGQPCEKLWPFKFLDSFCCSISSITIYYAPNRTSEWQVMTTWISREHLLFNFELLDILCALIGHPSEKLLPLEFLESIRCSISRVAIYYVPKSDIQVKGYDHLNLLRSSVVQFWASRYIMPMNRTSELNVMTIGISR